MRGRAWDAAGVARERFLEPQDEPTSRRASGWPSRLSIVVPVFNEADSLLPLLAEIDAAAAGLGAPYEVIFVDDGSTDGSTATLARIARSRPDVRVIEFRRNFGKAAALDAGFRAAAGDVVFTLDADLQDDPAEFAAFLAKLAEGYDVVSGWKHRRLDPLDKTAPSKVFNWVVGRVSGVRLNDFNCGFKAYRAEALEDLTLYGELHRFIPVLLHWRGFRVGEVPVNHRARRFGKSKFGASRLFKGALDLATVILNTRYQTRPLHVFGLAGTLLGASGFLILSYLTVLWFAGAGPIGDRPLFFLGILLAVSSLQFFTVGLLAEFIQRQASGGRPVWTVRSTHNLSTADALAPEIRRLHRTAALLREADITNGQRAWSQTPPSATTPQSVTGANTPTRTRFSA
jgi:glycosyltransferase involved in cell wall biosynthesis